MLLKNKTIIVTGASSGIGASAATLFSQQGANLILSARRAPLLENKVAELRSLGANAIYLSGDVQHESHASDLVDLAVNEFGGLDAAFNNAGMLGEPCPVPDLTAKDWNRLLTTNLSSAFFAAKYQIPAMKHRGGGSLVFTSSFIGHTIGMPGMGAYAASKAGINGLVQVLATEHGQDNIRFNALLPGGTRTDMAGNDPDFHEFISGLHALKRMAQPEEIAQAALFLVSDQSSFVTGSAMLVDGGNSINKI